MGVMPLYEVLEDAVGEVLEFPRIDRIKSYIRGFDGNRRDHIPHITMIDEVLRSTLRLGNAVGVHHLNKSKVEGYGKIPYEVLARTRDNQVAYIGMGGLCTAPPRMFQRFLDRFVKETNPELFRQLCIGLARAQFSPEERYGPSGGC